MSDVGRYAIRGPIAAVDQNGLPFDVQVQPGGSLCDEHGNTYIRAERFDDREGAAFVDQADEQDVILVAREDYQRALLGARS